MSINAVGVLVVRLSLGDAVTLVPLAERDGGFPSSRRGTRLAKRTRAPADAADPSESESCLQNRAAACGA